MQMQTVIRSPHAQALLHTAGVVALWPVFMAASLIFNDEGSEAYKSKPFITKVPAQDLKESSDTDWTDRMAA